MSSCTQTLSPTTTRWFPEPTIKGLIGSLNAEITRIDQECRFRQVPEDSSGTDDGQQWKKYAVIGTVALVVILPGLFLLTRDGNADHQFPGGKIAHVAALASLLLGGWYYFGRNYGLRGSRLKQRNQALRNLTTRVASLSYGHSQPVTGDSVGRLPWVATELDHVTECDLYGSYRGHRLTVLRCTYVVDLSLASLEQSAGVLAAKVMSHVQHEGVRRQELEAIVFADPVEAVPDVFWSAKKQPLSWYFKRAFRSLQLNIATDDSQWIATSDPERCREAFHAEVQQLFAARPNAILQVMGGHVIVIPQWWDWHRPEMAQDADQLAQNLDWACDLYESLREGEAPAATPVAEAQPAVPATSSASSPAALSSPTPLREAPVESLPLNEPHPVKPRWVRRILAVACGFAFFSVGALASLGLIVLTVQAKNAAGWPTAEGRIVESAVNVKEGKTELYSAHIEYDFTVDGRTYHSERLGIGPVKRACQRATIEAVLANYPANKPVTVSYNPDDPTEAVLEPHLASGGVHLGVTIFSVALAGCGVYLVYRGFRGPRPCSR